MASLSTNITGTIITGTIPAARQLVAQHDAARRGEGRAVWESPDILPRDAWMRRVWEECAWNDPVGTPVLLTRWQELVLWEEAIRSAERDILLNAHATARAAAQAWQLLHLWEAPLDNGAFERTEDCAAFAEWMKRVRKRLVDGGWITAAELPGALHKRLAFGMWKHDGPLELYGFDEGLRDPLANAGGYIDAAPADRRLFDALGATARALPACELQRWRVVCHDAADELTRAAMWARRKIETQPGVRIGIVVPALGSVAPAAERIFDEILHPSYGFDGGPQAFTITSGASLAGSPMIFAALLLLRLIDGVPREEAALVWRSPFMGIDCEDGARLDGELRRAKVDTVSVRTGAVARRFPDLAALAAKLRDRMRPSQWSEVFMRALTAAGWPGTRALTRDEVQTAEAWKELLSEFARLDSVIESMGRERAVSHLERMAEATRLSAERGAAPIQVLDVAETAGTSFDALWIVGLDAGAWPRAVQPNPFLPVALQRAAQMPGCSAEREFGYAQRVLERLFASAAEVVCSYPTHSSTGDKSEQQQASPFIATFPLSPSTCEGAIPILTDGALFRVFTQGIPLEPRPADENLALPPGTEQRGGSRVLANQSACPFRAFAVHRLNAREMDEPDVGLSPLDRGSLAHGVLELLWAELGTSERLQSLSAEALEALVHSCTESALDKYFAKHEASPALGAFRGLEQARLERLVRKWLDVEKTRPPFVVAYNEHERKVYVEGLRLDLRVDRIDRYADGTHAIIDYKTSKNLSANMWQGERPAEPQLPLYAVTSEAPVSEVAFAQISTATQAWIEKKNPELTDLLPEWNRVVHKLAADFLNGHAEVDPRGKPNPCDLCELHALCRIHEMKRLPREHVDLSSRTSMRAEAIGE